MVNCNLPNNINSQDPNICLVPIMESNSKSKSVITKDVPFVSSCLCTLNLFGETKYFLYSIVTINAQLVKNNIMTYMIVILGSEMVYYPNRLLLRQNKITLFLCQPNECYYFTMACTLHHHCTADITAMEVWYFLEFLVTSQNNHMGDFYQCGQNFPAMIRNFGIIWIRIYYPRSLRSRCVKGA